MCDASKESAVGTAKCTLPCLAPPCIGDGLHAPGALVRTCGSWPRWCPHRYVVFAALYVCAGCLRWSSSTVLLYCCAKHLLDYWLSRFSACGCCAGCVACSRVKYGGQAQNISRGAEDAVGWGGEGCICPFCAVQLCALQHGSTACGAVYIPNDTLVCVSLACCGCMLVLCLRCSRLSDHVCAWKCCWCMQGVWVSARLA
ncbi:hypothetical protein COO60DRAFT_1162816 [Scenedesmus sp. NREL 46B-D3]|nr:hypothetical protein COO60DRAFT_1162816 [Scenedesmus sp. NREL 46B-D3]